MRLFAVENKLYGTTSSVADQLTKFVDEGQEVRKGLEYEMRQTSDGPSRTRLFLVRSGPDLCVQP